MYNRASTLNLSLHIVLLLYILSLCKAEKYLSQKQNVTGRVPSILKAVIIIGKHGKLKDFNFLPKGLTLLLVFSYLPEQSLLHKILEDT